jgi:hypothetical protein
MKIMEYEPRFPKGFAFAHIQVSHLIHTNHLNLIHHLGVFILQFIYLSCVANAVLTSFGHILN